MWNRIFAPKGESKIVRRVEARASEVFGALSAAEREFLLKLDDAFEAYLTSRPLPSVSTGKISVHMDKSMSLEDRSRTISFPQPVTLPDASRTIARKKAITQNDNTVQGPNFKSLGSDPNRSVRPALLLWLCREQDVAKCLAGRKIEISNAYFHSRLNLSYLDIPAPLHLSRCWLPDGLELLSTKVAELVLDGSWLGPLEALHPQDQKVILADGLRVSGLVSLREKMHAAGEISLIGAEIGGDLTCSNARFENAGKIALALDRATVHGNVHFRRGFKVVGQVRLVGTKIGGNCDASSGSFENKADTALAFDGATIEGHLFLNKNDDGAFTAKGTVRLVGARIGRELNANGAMIIRARKPDANGSMTDPKESQSSRFALLADRTIIGGSLFLGSGFGAVGAVQLLGAKISGSLVCRLGKFICNGGWAINAESTHISENVFLGVSYAEIEQGWKVSERGNGFLARGEVRLFGATIGGNLIGNAAKISNASGMALNLENAKVAGSVLLRYQFDSEGQVRIYGATIGLDLDCQNGSFTYLSPEHKKQVALQVVKTKISGSAHLNGDFRRGNIMFDGATIGGDLKLTGAILGEWDGSLLLRATEVKGTLQLEQLKLEKATKVDLTDTTCGILADNAVSWPESGRVKLDGFVYRQFKTPGTAKTRLDWLGRQLPERLSLIGRLRTRLGRQLPERPSYRTNGFHPFPYRQAATVLRTLGLTEDARDVLIEMAKIRRKSSRLRLTSRGWQILLSVLIGSGYRPIRAFFWLLLFWTIGFLVYGAAYQAHLVVPLDKDALEIFAQQGKTPDSYEPFCSFAYAVDSSLPVVSLGQRDKWHFAALDKVASQRQDRRGAFYNFICLARFTQGAIAAAPSPAASTLVTILTVFRWFYVVFGWFLTTMFVAGVAGLVGRE